MWIAPPEGIIPDHHKWQILFGHVATKQRPVFWGIRV